MSKLFVNEGPIVELREEKANSRSEIGKRLRNAYSEIVADCGGTANMSYAKRGLIERFTFMEEFLRRIELELIDDPVKNQELMGRWFTGVTAMKGLATTLGLHVAGTSAIDALYAAPDGPDPDPDDSTADE